VDDVAAADGADSAGSTGGGRERRHRV
jgi:hypothetical protein